jgi:ribose transport system permease protein
MNAIGTSANAVFERVRHAEKERYAAFVALFILTVVSSFLSPYFLQWQNLINILRQVSYTGIIALGMTFVIVSGGIDLSVGSMAAFVGSLSVLSLNALVDAGLSPALAVAAAVGSAVASGLACGAANGILITKGRIAPFIVTLGTMALFRSLSLYMADAGEFQSRSSLFGALGSSSPGRVPVPVMVMIALAAALSFVFTRTRYGRYVRAVGSNARVARYSAIDVDRTRLVAYALNGLMVGVSAVLICMRFNSVGSSTLGVNYELDAIAAVIIGGTSMAGGRGTVWGTVVGAITLGVINNMLNMVGISPYLQGTVKGLVIIGAVFIQRQRQ